MTYQVRSQDLAGFDLYGTRNDDGTITLGYTEPKASVPEFPAEVELLGNVYTLEYVKQQGDNGEEWAKTAPADDPRRRICWGIYV